MRGIVYKDFKVIVKQIKPIYLLAFISFMTFVVYKTNIFGAIIASITVGLTAGMVSIYLIQADEQANWKKHELTLPVSKPYIIGSKYLIQVLASIFTVVFTIIAFGMQKVLIGHIDPVFFKTGLILSFVQPIVLGSIMIPLSLKFGTQKGRFISLLLLFPTVSIISGFEDGIITNTLLAKYDSFLLFLVVISLVLFISSYLLSLFIYKDKLS